MEPFFAATPCPQCRATAASFKLHTGACPKLGVDVEHMHRQCPSCGHEWAEAPRTLRSVRETQSERVRLR